MDRDFTNYQVGHLFDPARKKWSEGAMYNYHNDMHQLLVLFNHIRPFEQRDFQQGMVRFALYVDGDVINLLFKFDGVECMKYRTQENGSRFFKKQLPYFFREHEKILPLFLKSFYMPRA